MFSLQRLLKMTVIKNFLQYIYISLNMHLSGVFIQSNLQ